MRHSMAHVFISNETLGDSTGAGVSRKARWSDEGNKAPVSVPSSSTALSIWNPALEKAARYVE